MENTKIQWCHKTWSPWRGCTHGILPDGTEHPGCGHCYAEAMAKRNPKVLGKWGSDGTRVRAADAQWKLPIKWNEECGRRGTRERVFVNSISDIFEDWRGVILNHEEQQLFICPECEAIGSKDGELFEDCETCNVRLRPLCMDDLLREVLDVVSFCTNLDFLFLTKRPGNIARSLHADKKKLYTAPHAAPGTPEANIWHWSNIWLGTSVSDQMTAELLVPRLLQCRAYSPVLWISYGPALGDVNWRQLIVPSVTDPSLTDHLDALTGERCSWDTGCLVEENGPALDWIVTEGESGSHARRFDIAWMHHTQDQCRSQSVPVFNKQVGSNAWHQSRKYPTRDKKGGVMEEWPEDVRVREYPQVASTGGLLF